jgi:hypothetical protein
MNRHKEPRTLTKFDGNGIEITIPNPDYYNEDAMFHKVRKCNNAQRKNKRKK